MSEILEFEKFHNFSICKGPEFPLSGIAITTYIIQKMTILIADTLT